MKTNKPSLHGRWGVSQCVIQAILSSKQLHLQASIARSHWSGSRALASTTPSTLDPHWDSAQISCGYPKSWRSCSSAGPAFSHAAAVLRCGWCGLSQLKALALGLGGSWVGPLGCSRASTTRVSSPTVSRWGVGPALLPVVAGKRQDQLSCTHSISALVRDGTRSPECACHRR